MSAPTAFVAGTRPSPITGGWLPDNHADRLDVIGKLIQNWSKKASSWSSEDPTTLKHDSTRALRALIDDNAQLSMLFRSMFDEIPFSHRYDPAGKSYNIINYEQLIAVFDTLLDKPPEYNENMMIALPFTLLLEWPMATRGGIAAFLSEKLNVKLGAMLNEWGAYLMDPNGDSKSVLTKEKGWLCDDARAIMKKRDPGHRKFEDLYMCDQNDTYLGYKHWDDFFTRKFKPGVRPVESAGNDTISNGCESSPYAIKQLVKETEKFWIKGQPYSLKHMLMNAEDAEKFAGGTVYQAFLSPLTYHRWHSPINGTITKLVLIKGSYFSISPINAFPDPETFANTQSQAYISSVATRALIYLNNSTVGDMVMMPIGMVEVSTCEFKANILDSMIKQDKKPGDDPSITVWLPNGTVTVKKGDELGMFHFGGSTHCLIFGPNVNIRFWRRAMPQDSDPDYFVPLNATLATVEQSGSSIYRE